MATTIKLKKSSVSGRIPSSGDLEYGEIAINYADGIIYYKASDNSIKSISGNSIGVDSAATIALIDSAYVQARQSATGGTDPIFKTISVSGQSDIVAELVEDTLTVAAGNNISLTTDAGSDTLTITGDFDSASVVGIVDSAYVQLRQTAQDFAYSSLTGAPTALSSFTNDTNYLDSTSVQGVVDSSYVQLRQDFAYSSLTGAPTALSSFTNDTNYLDSTTVQGVIDASYIQTNQIKYSTADFADSAFVTAQIDALIGGAPAALDTLNELAAALNDDDSAYATLLGLINAKSDLDSANISSIITADVNASFINALTIDADTLDGAASSYYLNYNNFLNTPTVLDSADVTLIAQSTAGTVDSADIIAIVDSAYVQARQSTVSGGATVIENYFYTADSGQTIFTGSDDQSNTLSYTAEKLQVYLNGVLLRADTDYTATNSTSIVLTEAVDSGDDVSISTYVTQAVGTLDSSGVIQLIDSDYIAARTTAGTDSAAIINLIDSDYIAARTTAGTDSATVTSIVTSTVDASYVQSRQIKYTTADFADSNYVNTIAAGFLDSAEAVALIDSAYVQLRQASTDLTNYRTVTQINALIDSGIDALINGAPGALDTLNELAAALGDDADFATTVTNSIASKIDSANAVTIINNQVDSAYIQLRQDFAYSSLTGAPTSLPPDGVDSAPTIDLIQATIDNGYIATIVDSNYVIARQLTISGGATTVENYYYTADSGQTTFSGNDDASNSLSYTTDKIQVYLNGLLLKDSDDYVAENGTSIVLTEAADSSDILTITTYTTGAVGTLDSSGVTNLIDSAYIQLRQSSVGSGGIDSATVSAIITADVDKAFVDALNVDADTLDGVNSASFLRSDADDTFSGTLSGAGSINITGPIASSDSAVFGGDGSTGGVKIDDGAITIRTGTGNVAYVDLYCEVSNAHRTRVKSAAHSEYSGNVDVTLPTTTGTLALTSDISSTIIADVDSAYVQLKAKGLNYLSLSNKPLFATVATTGDYGDLLNRPTSNLAFTNDAGYLTSATTQTLIDSAYIQLRQSSVGSGGTDSAAVIAIVDSDYVIARQLTVSSGATTVENYYYTADSGQTTFTGSDDQSNTLSYTANKIQVYLNGVLLRADTDYTATSGTSIVLTEAVDSGDDVSISTYVTQAVGTLDSSGVIQLIDSAYIQLRQSSVGSGGIDSAAVKNIFSGGTGVTYNSGTGEISIGQAVGTSDDVTFADVTVDNLTVSGTTTTVNSITYTVVDPLLHLADSNETSDTVDIGFIGHYSPDGGSTKEHTGFFRDASNSQYYIFNGLQDAGFDSSLPTNIVNRAGTGFELATLNVATINGVYSGFDSDVTSAGLITASDISTTVDSAYVQLRQDFAYSSLTGAPTSLSPDGVDSAPTIDLINSTVNSGYIATIVDSNYIIARQVSFLDSADVIQLIDSDYIAARTTAGTDSAAIINLIDSDYIAARTTAGTDSAAIINLIDSAYVQARAVGVDGGATTIANYYYTADSGQISFSGSGLSYTAGKIQVYLNGILLKDSDDYTATNGTSITLSDSADINDILSVITYTTQSVGTLDSVGVLSLINQNPTLDSAEVIQLIDSSYIQLRQNDVTAGATTISNFYYTADSGQISFSGADDANASLTYTTGKIQVYLNGILLKDSDDYTASNGTSIILSDSADLNDIISVITYKTNAVGTLDSAGIIELIDSDYIAARAVALTDSAAVIQIIDSAHVQLRQTAQDFSYSSLTGAPTAVSSFTNDANYLDSTTVQGVIDASYIQSNQIKYSTADFADSAFVTSEINSLINGAPGALDTLNELAAALGDDADFATTVTNSIAAKLDSAQTIAIIDSAYIQLRQDFAYSSLTGAPTAISSFTNDTNYLDSSTATNLIDSDYIELRRPAEVIFNVVNNGSSAYTFTGDGFSSSADNPTLYLERGLKYKFNLNASGHPFNIRVSNGGSAYSAGVTGNGTQTGVVTFTPDMNAPNTLVYQCAVHGGMVGDIVILDNASLFDSAQTQALIDASIRDSAFVTGIVTTSYVNSLGITAGLDSATIINLIDSAYVQAREAAGGGGSGTVDSADIIAIVDSDYIQARQSTVANGVASIANYLYTADSDQTSFSGVDDAGSTLSYTAGQIQVYLNGILLRDSDDYVATNGTSVVLNTGANLNDELSVSKFFLSSATGAGATQINSFYYTADSGQTSFTGVDDFSNTLSYTSEKIQVFVNGVLIRPSDYTASNGSSLVLDIGTDSGDDVVISSYDTTAAGLLDSAGVITLIDSDYVAARSASGGTDSAAVISLIENNTSISPITFTFTADSAQTTFSGSDDNSATLSYSAGSQTVFLNGILLIDSDDYTASNGTSIVLTSEANLNDVLSVITYKTVLSTVRNTDIDNFYFTADSGQTTFSGTDDFSNTLSYTADKVQVYLNGVLLKDSSDYTAENGSTIVLTSGIDSADVLAISAYSTSPVTLLNQNDIETIIDSDYVSARAGGGATASTAFAMSLLFG